MHKGPDTVRMLTKDLYQNLINSGINMQDEVLKFQTFRYLSAGEALCRIFGYNLTHSTVGCSRLTVHLEGMDWVGDGAVQQGGASTKSTLLQYFARPASLSGLLYVEYFSQYNVTKATAAHRQAASAAGEERVKPQRGNAYLVDALGNKVSVRNRGSMHVARIFPVSVTQGEQYYLRMLLTAVAGASFVSLRTVGARVYDTYREAAEARGLLSVEREFMEGMGQLATGLDTGLSTIADLRNTFVMMAVSGGDGVPVLELLVVCTACCAELSIPYAKGPGKYHSFCYRESRDAPREENCVGLLSYYLWTYLHKHFDAVWEESKTLLKRDKDAARGLPAAPPSPAAARAAAAARLKAERRQ